MSQDPVEDLRQEIEKGHVLVVVGSGVSSGATNKNPLASWKGLLEDGIKRCIRKCGADWVDRRRKDLATGKLNDMLMVAEYVATELGFPKGKDYRDWLAESVGRLRVQDRSVLEAIRDLGFPLATTNYDGLLEEVTGHPAVTWRGVARIRQVLQGHERGILHLHGFWAEPESVVLGIRSYDRILGHELAQTVLRAAQTLKTFLFIGCGDGLDDPNFSALFEWARSVLQDLDTPHFRLCLDEEEADLLKKHQDDSIRPVPYGPKHPDLLRFLQDLKPPSRRSTAPSPSPASPAPSLLPPKPRCFGRDDEIRDLVETLLQPSPPPTPILGGPGAGKTTITQAALHDRRVADRFRARRFFVHCDGAKTRDALVSEIAKVMAVEPGATPEISLFQALTAGPALLVLDNAETPWEGATTSVEDLLSSLSSIEGLALVASIRGDQRPLGPPWRSSIRVGPLGLEAARDAFLAVAGEKFRNDPDLDRLLEAVDRLALAINFLAHEAEGEPNLSVLWRRWQARRTDLLRHAEGTGRLTNIEVSLDLSWNGPRMTPAARRLLSVMALLPDGVAREDLDALLPGEVDEAVSVLRKVGLGFDQGDRLRVLAPVREYVRGKHQPGEEDLKRAVDYYLGIARKGKLVGLKEGGAEAATKLIHELGNVDSMISQALEASNPEPGIEAACNLGWFTCISGWGSLSGLERALALAQSTRNQRLEADCILRLGQIAHIRSDHNQACTRYEQALALYRQISSVSDEALCILNLGDIALRRSDHDAARARYEEALPLFRNVGDVLGEANCIQRLGDIALARSDHDAARESFREALGLYGRIPEPYSIGWTKVRLARLEPEGSSERRNLVKETREAWESIKRPDLVERLKAEFGEDFEPRRRGAGGPRKKKRG